MSHAKLSNSFIVQTDLTDANLKNVRFVKADLSHSISREQIWGADLTEANLTGCILHGAILYNCIISGTDFADADLAARCSTCRNATAKSSGNPSCPGA